MASVRVVSEIGPLRTVLVHTPGREILAVTPGTREEYLYDDVISLETASAEHAGLVAILRRFATVYEIRDLLRDLVNETEVRAQLVGGLLDVVSLDRLSRLLTDAPADEFIDMLIHGHLQEGGPIAEALNVQGYVLPALPNLFFTRDIGIAIGSNVCIGAMRYEARWSEELLVRTLFTCHERLSNSGILYDGAAERGPDRTLEGGDVHPVREDLLVLGCSDRTSPAGLDELCDRVFAAGDVRDVIVVVMPGEPTAIHLDMLFTQVDREICVVSPRHFIGLERLPVLHRSHNRAGVAEATSLFAALKAVDFPLEPVLCGGPRRSDQEREQWGSGCNLLTVKPGVAIAYQRNEETLAAFAGAGYDILDGERWLEEGGDADRLEKTILTMRGNELVRGGGGPRCMTLPVYRDS